MPSSNETIAASITNTEKPLFEIELGPDAGMFRPRSLEELRKWLDTERNFWAWVAQPPAMNIPDIQRQRHNEDNLQAKLNEAQNHLNQHDQQSYIRAIDQIRNLLTERYNLRALYSQSPRAQYLDSIPDKHVAGYALRYFAGHNVSSPGNPAELRGFVAGIAFDLNIAQTRSEAATAALSDRLNQIGMEHEALRVQAGKLQDQYAETSENIAALFEQQRKLYDEAHALRDTQFKELLLKAAGDLDRLRTESLQELKAISETYDKKLALQSAVTYLDTKASSHRTVAVVTGIASLLAAGGFAALASWLGSTLLTGDKPAWNHVAVAALSATLCFWFLRILVRMFLSNLHLTTDTRSRSTLMQTYLALLREGGGLKDDDRELILKILFRPFSDGMVRDDAVPPSLWDVATRVAGGK